MYLVACGVTGFGDWILEVDNGRPLGISTVRLRLSRRDSLLEEEEDEYLSREECFDECLSFSLSEECLEDECDLEEDDLCEEEDLCDDFSCGTSRMFKILPVVGSMVESCPGS